MNNNNVKVIVYTDSDNFINYLVYHNIKYKDLIKQKDSYILTTDIDSYKPISRRYKTKIIRYYGKNYIINFISTQKYMIISFILSMFLLNLLTSTIFNIQINTDDIELKNKISNILNDYDISLYKKKKSFKEIEEIKRKILKENDDILEWIAINEKGCKYEVSLTKKVKSTEGIKNSSCDIVSVNDGVIKYIVVSSGTKLKEVNEYIHKNDVLITGNIYKNEEIISEVCASGKVYAEVWYLVKVIIPLEYVEYVETGKVINHYYLELFDKRFTITGKYDSKNVMSEKRVILDKPYLMFKLFKETKKEYEYKTFTLNESEAYNEAINRSESKIKSMINKDEYIISKNVLKKDLIRSKMYVEVFFKVYKNVGVTSDIVKKEELNGINNN